MLKIGKLHKFLGRQLVMLATLFKNYFKGAIIWWLFAQLYKIPLIVLCWKSWQLTTVSRFQNRICIIESQEKENFIYSLMKKWEQLHLTLDNLKSEEGRGNYLDNTQIYSRRWEFESLNVIFISFAQKVPVR